MDTNNRYLYQTAMTLTVNNEFEGDFITDEYMLNYVEWFVRVHVHKLTYLFISIERNKRNIPHAHILLNHVEELDMPRLRSEYLYSNYIYAEPIASEQHYLNYISKYGKGYVKEMGTRGTIPAILGKYINQSIFDLDE